jgi:hypothetical protein
MANKKSSNQTYSEQDSTEKMTERGLVEPRIILGAFALLLVAGPLVTLGIKIQSSLAATPAFSWLSAGLIAFLLVAIVVARLLGLE